MLYEMNIPLRPDWETVVGPVVDFALTPPEVHPEKLVISGWSLGDYLAPRAASAEHRLAACIADPGQWPLADFFRAFAGKIGIPASAVADLGALDEADIQRVERAIDGIASCAGKSCSAASGRTGKQDCATISPRPTLHNEGPGRGHPGPTLLTAAENDPLAEGAQTFYDALRCQRTSSDLPPWRVQATIAR